MKKTLILAALMLVALGSNAQGLTPRLIMHYFN